MVFVPKHGGYHSQVQTGLDHIHKEDLSFLWTVVINFTIFFALYKYRKYTIFLHFVGGFGVSVVTALTSLPLLLKETIPSTHNPTRVHMIVGIAILSILFLEVLLGCLSKLLNIFKLPSVALHYMNKAHAVLGYCLAILCKFQYYYITSNKDYVYYTLLAQDILFAVLIIIRKLTFPTLSQKIEPKYENQHIVISVTSLADLREKEQQADDREYCIFGNHIYDMNPIKWVHPVGYQILHLVKNREIDRFIYGMFRAENLPRLPPNTHSFKSLDLLGKPVARIIIPYPYKSIPESPFTVKIISIQSISIQCQIYHVELQCQTPLEYEGYSGLAQLGRFYSLTANHKVTRLYTAVNFLHRSNLQMLKTLGLVDVLSPLIDLPMGTEVEMQSDRLSSSEGRCGCTIPLMIKVYEDGTLPNIILANKAESLLLSPPKGFGLQLGKVEAGTILIIAGGTGLFPFSDLIDLLYKDALIRKDHPYKNFIIQNNTILSANPFAKYHFKLFLACQFIEDIHPITLKQLQQLPSLSDFQFRLKLREKVSREKLAGITMIDKPFQDVLEMEMKDIQEVSKVWVCGPPRMCESINKFFETNRDKDLVHFI